MGIGNKRRQIFVWIFTIFLSVLPREAKAGGPVTSAAPSGNYQLRGPGASRPLSSSQKMEIGGSTLQIDIAQGAIDLPAPVVLAWVRRAATAVVAYYGKFPVPRARILILPVANDRGVLQGTTWGNMAGFPGFTRMRLGQHTMGQDLIEDWTMTHELVHMAFPDLPDNQHWMEEGLATYVEPIARVQTGELKSAQIWRDMMDGMPKGEPGAGDLGLDRTETWGRTYWGGALFCLSADVEIRRLTSNRKGLQDALRAVVNAGGTIDKDWTLMQSLTVGDKATGTTVLTDLYRKWGNQPTSVDLHALWRELGVTSKPGESGAVLSQSAPLASIRDAITSPRNSP